MRLFDRIDASMVDFLFGSIARIDPPMGAANRVYLVVIWSDVFPYVCFFSRIDTPMETSNLDSVVVIWSVVLLFVCLSARIGDPMWNFKLGFYCDNSARDPTVCVSFR